MKEYLHNFIELKKGPWRWSVGFQAALAIGLPNILFTVFGNQNLGLIASLGGLTALYCAARSPRDRMIFLPLIGLGLVLSAIIGTMFSSSPWLSLFGLIIVCTLACIFTLGMGIGPPGPIMFVLVASVCAFIADAGGAYTAGGIHISLIVGMGALIAYFVVIAYYAFIRNSNKDYLPPLSLKLNFDKEAAAISARVISGMTIAGILSLQLSIERGYWVSLTTIAILQVAHQRNLTTVRAIQRVLGTILGVFVFELIRKLEPEGIFIALTVMSLQFFTEVVVTRNYILGLIFITPLALINSTISRSGDVYVTIQERVVDTILGALVALLVLWVGGYLWKEIRKRNKINWFRIF